MRNRDAPVEVGEGQPNDDSPFSVADGDYRGGNALEQGQNGERIRSASTSSGCGTRRWKIATVFPTPMYSPKRLPMIFKRPWTSSTPSLSR